MKKVIIMLILALNFVCYADGFTYMKPEEAEALINYYNSSTFPRFTLQDAQNLSLNTGIECQSAPIEHIINVSLKYVHYSLANCRRNNSNNRKNYVSSIKSQTGGTCLKWAITAATEIVLSTLLDDYIQPNVTKWSPVNLSEAWTVITTKDDINYDRFNELFKKGIVHDYYFPFYSEQDPETFGDDRWKDYWNEIKSYGYSSPECNTATNGTDYNENISQCMLHEAKNQNAVSVYPLLLDGIEANTQTSYNPLYRHRK
ncbi:hypothetical protein IKO70_04800 [bacterium]|nr:hypothetical protein [bacterium]